MNNIIKLLAVIAFFFVATFINNAFIHSGASTIVANQLTVEAVNGGDSAFLAQSSYLHMFSGNSIVWISTILLAMVLFVSTFIRLAKNKSVATSLLLVSAITLLPSCERKPYQVPVYKEILNNQTAFVIPLEGSGDRQAKLDSKELYEKNKVATKRIEIPTRWNQTGRWETEGEWIPTVTVIVVDRSPVTRNWQADKNGSSKEDQAIWVESSDSVGFSMGFNCTAFIKEEDTSEFLYWYSSGSLSGVMDSEIRGSIQRVTAQESAKFPLDDLRNRKNEVAAAVVADVIPFFAKRGITITTIGMFGGMTYENKEIQQAIDNVFVAQQQKNVALAKFDAQKKENERVILEAQGAAQQRQIQSEAEAKAINALTQAVANGGSNYLALKSLEVQIKQTEKWDGRLPTITSGSTPLIDAGKFLTK